MIFQKTITISIVRFEAMEFGFYELFVPISKFILNSHQNVEEFENDILQLFCSTILEFNEEITHDIEWHKEQLNMISFPLLNSKLP